MKRWLLTTFVALVVLLALPQSSWAQDASDLDRAKASFKAGANAYAAGDYLAAIQALESAYALSPLPAIAFSLAQAERKQYFVDQDSSHLVRALSLFRRYLEQDLRGARREDAQLALRQLEPLLTTKPSGHATSPKAEARPTRLMIVAEAPGARITLDEGTSAGSPLIREVAPGKHRVRVRAEGYLDVEREVVALAGELILSEVRLGERPSLLYVWAPGGAEVYIDGVYVAQGGQLVTVPLVAGPHQLSVALKGRRLVRRDVLLERGKTHTEIVSLEPTRQRTISEILFVGGGATLGASLVLSALAIQSENGAEEFLHDQRYGNVKLSELVAYNARLVERNRYRTAAAVSVAASAGLFITGLFLHELDQPRSPAAPRRDLPQSDGPTVVRQMSLTPAVAPDQLGLSLQGKF